MTREDLDQPCDEIHTPNSGEVSRRRLLTGALSLAASAAVRQDAKVLYENPLASEKDVRGFRLEGQAGISFPNGRMRMENKLDSSRGQDANFVYWCPEEFPDGIAITWEFRPIREPGLCILFFSARGIGDQDLFDPSLAKRVGPYNQYHSGDIKTLHVSYFRRIGVEDRSFHLCNLRKSKGFHLVAQGADPIPSVPDVVAPYRMRIEKQDSRVAFFINDLPIFTWMDDGKSHGPVLRNSGKVGFRQMAPTVGEYGNLKVARLSA